MLKDLTNFIDSCEEVITILEKYYDTYKLKYSIRTFEIEKSYNDYITSEEISINTKFLILEEEFFEENIERFSPTSDDFCRWLNSLPVCMNDFFRERGLEKSLEVRDFQSFYFKFIKDISFEEFLISKVSVIEVEYFRTKEKERNDAQLKIKNDPIMNNIIRLFYKGYDNMDEEQLNRILNDNH